MHTAKNMHQILDLALPAYDELFDEIKLDGLVENKGILYIWNDKDLKSRELEIRVRDELGVKQQLVNKDEIRDLEPKIKKLNLADYFKVGMRVADLTPSERQLVSELLKKTLGGKPEN